MRHKRRSGVVLGGLGSVDRTQGTPTGSQAYSIRLPAKNALPPEVWFAATVFEGIAYPYHKMRVQAEIVTQPHRRRAVRDGDDPLASTVRRGALPRLFYPIPTPGPSRIARSIHKPARRGSRRPT